MRVRLFAVAVCLCFVLPALSQSAPNAKLAPGFIVDNIDKGVDPCVDCYPYARGNWMNNAVIPPDQAQWVSFAEVQQRNQTIMREILEKAAVDSPNRDAIDQKIGDFYGACMDEKAEIGR